MNFEDLLSFRTSFFNFYFVLLGTKKTNKHLKEKRDFPQNTGNCNNSSHFFKVLHRAHFLKKRVQCAILKFFHAFLNLMKIILRQKMLFVEHMAQSNSTNFNLSRFSFVTKNQKRIFFLTQF